MTTLTRGTAYQLCFVLVKESACRVLVQSIIKRAVDDLRLPKHRDAALEYLRGDEFCIWAEMVDLPMGPFWWNVNRVLEMPMIDHSNRKKGVKLSSG